MEKDMDMAKATATTKVISAAFAIAAMLAGCRNQPQTASSTPSTSAPAISRASTLTPEDLGTLGAQIQKNPNDAPRLLQDRGLTQEQFAAQVRKVAEDPAASKRYAAAFRKTGS